MATYRQGDDGPTHRLHHAAYHSDRKELAVIGDKIEMILPTDRWAEILRACAINPTMAQELTTAMAFLAVRYKRIAFSPDHLPLSMMYQGWYSNDERDCNGDTHHKPNLVGLLSWDEDDRRYRLHS